jgi:hypothetical protein
MSEEHQEQFEGVDVESHAHRAGANDEPAAEEDNEVEAHIMREP